MNKLKEEVLSFLNMGLHPTVISMQDDGLFYLFDKLLQGTTVSNSYDPVFSFVHVTLNYLDQVTSTSIENEINEALRRDKFEGDSIIETYVNGVETVCVIDDIAFLDDVPNAIKNIDSLIQKYRGILHFVYVVENPMLVHELKSQINPASSFLDALMYQEVGKYWETQDLVEICEKQFKKKLDTKKIKEITKLSNNHLGIFVRLYKDECLGLSSANRYVNLLIDNLDRSLLNTFKKVVKEKELNEDEKIILNYFQKIGFIKENKITIPLLQDIIDGYIIPSKIEIDEDKLKGLDLNEFNRTEREILENLMKTEEIIPKDKMGDIIWKEKVGEKYSEWAIDQRIARLRRKLIDFGFNVDIQTVYGKGYKIVFIDKK